MLWFKEQWEEEITSYPRIETSLWLGNRTTAGWKVETQGKCSCCWFQEHPGGGRVSRKEYSGCFLFKDSRVPLIG